jgi:hypothetical protein
MPRDIESEDPRSQPETRASATQPSRPPALDRSGRARDDHDKGARDLVRLPAHSRREPVQVGSDLYHLRASEVTTLTAVGTFRALFARDLEHYASERTRQADVRSLQSQGLLERRTLVLKGEAKPVDVLALTRAGKKLLESHTVKDEADARDSQHFYAGFVKPRELRHDATLYRVVAAERDRIESAGGKVTRVVLDHELKGQLYKHGPEQQSTVAASLELPINDGHVQLPDARVEYENAAGDRAHIDLELVTEHYHGGHLSGKLASGFTLYSFGGSRSGRARGTPHDPRYMENILR